MRLAFALAILPAAVFASRRAEGGTVLDNEQVHMNDADVSKNRIKADSGAQLAAGAVLRDRYVLAERIEEPLPGREFPDITRRQFSGDATHLASGGFGDAWRAYDSELKMFVAVKIFYDRSRDKYLTWQSASEKQKQELKDNAKECFLVQMMLINEDMYVGSERICQCFKEHVTDAENTDLPVFLVLELCGAPVQKVLYDMSDDNTTNVAKARNWVKQLLEGIAFIQMLDPPLIHHDLKPDNVVVDGNNLKLIDWGAAMPATKEQQYKSCVMTKVYCAPEVYDYPTARSFAFPAHSYDVFATGLMYIRFLCPKVTYFDWWDFDNDKMMKLAKKDVEKLLAECPDLANDQSIHEDVELIARMISRYPDKRPSPTELLEAPVLNSNSWYAPVKSTRFRKGDHVELIDVGPGVIADVREDRWGDSVYDVASTGGQQLLKQGARENQMKKFANAKIDEDWLVAAGPLQP